MKGDLDNGLDYFVAFILLFLRSSEHPKVQVQAIQMLSTESNQSDMFKAYIALVRERQELLLGLIPVIHPSALGKRFL